MNYRFMEFLLKWLQRPARQGQSRWDRFYRFVTAMIIIVVMSIDGDTVLKLIDATVSLVSSLARK